MEYKMADDLKEKATRNLQAHLDKVVAVAQKNEVILTTNGDLSVGQLMALYKEQTEIEGTINWIINVEKRINPQKIVKAPNRLG